MPKLEVFDSNVGLDLLDLSALHLVDRLLHLALEVVNVVLHLFDLLLGLCQGKGTLTIDLHLPPQRDEIRCNSAESLWKNVYLSSRAEAFEALF